MDSAGRSLPIPVLDVNDIIHKIFQIFSIHVRRTDKIDVEAAHHGLEEYLKWARLYYDKLELSTNLDARRVFIATDDKNLLTEAKTR